MVPQKRPLRDSTRATQGRNGPMPGHWAMELETSRWELRNLGTSLSNIRYLSGQKGAAMASRSQPQQDLSVGYDKADLARLLAHPPAALDDLCNDPAIR